MAEEISEPTLYEILGLPGDATVPAIRAAYREAARSAHPDVGGDPVQFARLTLARDVLCDAEMRRKYDETGVVPADQAKNAAAILLQNLIQSFGGAVQSVLQAGGDPMTCDMARVMLAKIDDESRTLAGQIDQADKSLAILRRMDGAFRTPALDEPNYMQIMVLDQINQLSDFLTNMKARAIHLGTTRDYLRKISFMPGLGGQEA